MKVNGYCFDNIIPWLLLLLIPFGFLAETAVIILVLLRYKWYNVIPFIFLGICLFAHFLPNILFDYSAKKPLQQILLIVVYCIGYSTFYFRCIDDVQSLWDKYLKVCVFFAYVAILQYVVFLFTGIDPLAYARPQIALGPFLRLHSYFEEPGTFATFLSPCVAYYFFDQQYQGTHKRSFFVIIITYVFSASAVGFLVLLLLMFYYILKSRLRVVFISLMMISLIRVGTMGMGDTNQIDGETGVFEQSYIKIVETSKAFANMTPHEFEFLNQSTYASISNLWVSINAPNRILGTGIGTHPDSYMKLYQSDFEFYGLNKEDAYSLFIRVFSEYGLLGISLLLAAFIFFYNRTNVINKSVLLYLIACLVRGGHYTYNGFILFVFMYCLTSSYYQKKCLSYDPKDENENCY